MSFFEHHSWVVLFFLAVFPRLTLLFAGFATGGLLWWLGWLILPRLLVAILSLAYWKTDPVLVVVAWVLAFAGTSGEAKVARRRR